MKEKTFLTIPIFVLCCIGAGLLAFIVGANSHSHSGLELKPKLFTARMTEPPQLGTGTASMNLGRICVKIQAFDQYGDLLYPPCEIWVQIYEASDTVPVAKPGTATRIPPPPDCTTTFLLNYLKKSDSSKLNADTNYQLAVWYTRIHADGSLEYVPYPPMAFKTGKEIGKTDCES